MAVKFEIEMVSEIPNQGFIIFAKCLEMKKGFFVTEYSKLGKFDLNNYINTPRKLDKDGQPRTDLFAFQLKNEADFDKIQEGEIIELTPGNKLEFLLPWFTMESNGIFEKELIHEISKEHILHEKKAKAIAKREDCDDVLFKIGETEYAVVHLTWSSKKETTSNYPRTTIYNHWTEVYEKVIIPDSQPTNL